MITKIVNRRKSLIWLSTLILAIATLFIYSSHSFASTGGYKLRWPTNQHNGWPFDPTHFVGDIYGDSSSSSPTWKLGHYHMTMSQKESCGDLWNLNKVRGNSLDGAASFTDTSHSNHAHKQYNYGHYEEVNRIYYPTKQKAVVTFEGTTRMVGCKSNVVEEIYSGSLWRSSF